MVYKLIIQTDHHPKDTIPDFEGIGVEVSNINEISAYTTNNREKIGYT